MFTLGAKSSTYEILKFWHHDHSILSFQNCKKYVSIVYKLFNLEYQLAYLCSSQIHATYTKKKKNDSTFICGLNMVDGTIPLS